MPAQQETVRIQGGSQAQIFTGVGAHTIAGGLRAYAFTVRATGTTFAALTAQDEFQAAATAYLPTGLVGTVLNQGEYFKFGRSVVTFTLTNATDSVIMWCDRPY